jgi:putative MATE family efflux protein
MLFSNRDLFKITTPLIIQQVLAVTIGMVDTMMVSEAGEAAVSGVSLVSTLDTLLILLFSSLISGGSVVISQLLGRGNPSEARDASKQLFYVSVGVATAVSATVLIFRVPLLSFLFGDAEAEVMANALSYFSIVSLSFPFLAINNVGGTLYRVMGNSVMSMSVSLMMNLVNVCGNALLIYVFHLGAAGAALATLCSRFVGTVVTLILIRKRSNPLYIDRFFSYKPDFQVIKEILRIGVPNGIENSMFQFGKLVTQSLIASMPTAVIAANAVAMNLVNYQYMPGGATGSVIITVVGRCVGAKEKEQAKHYTRLMCGLTYAFLWIVIITTFLLAKPLIGIYELSPEGSQMAYDLIFYHSICAAIVWPIAFTLPNAFRAASDVKFPMVISLFSMWVFRVALGYVFTLDSITVLGLTIPGFGMGIMGVWIAMTIDWLFRTVLFLVRFLTGQWLTKYRPKETITEGSAAASSAK